MGVCRFVIRDVHVSVALSKMRVGGGQMKGVMVKLDRGGKDVWIPSKFMAR